jgi:SAM-dependent methyltransferase
MTLSRDASHFERLYAANSDPWGLATSAYEREKYAASLAAIADRRYAAALEVGCSIGVLSRQVAPLCEDFLGIDITEMPLPAARARCADLPQARFARMTVPQDWPEGRRDLILLSEVLYFLDRSDLTRLCARINESLLTGGRVLLVNWTGSAGDPHDGNAAAEFFIAESGFPIMLQSAQPGYRLDLLQRA